MNRNNEIGQKGESIAVRYLSDKGFQILERNWRFKKAEVDIIAKDTIQNVLLFIEVKTRTSASFGHPSCFVDEKKEVLLYDAATAYCEGIGHDWEIRFDIIGILYYGDQYELNHIEDAFFPWDI